MTSRNQCVAAQAIAAVSIADASATARPKTLPLDLGRVVRDARALADISQELLAKLSGAPRAWIQKWERGEGAPRADHLLRAPREYRRAVVRALALFDGDLVHEGTPDELTHAARVSVLTNEATDPVRAYLAALADGDLSAAERAEVCRELRELIACAGAALLALESEGR